MAYDQNKRRTSASYQLPAQNSLIIGDREGRDSQSHPGMFFMIMISSRLFDILGSKKYTKPNSNMVLLGCLHIHGLTLLQSNLSTVIWYTCIDLGRY